MAKDATTDKATTSEAKAAASTTSSKRKADWAIAHAPAHTYTDLAKISAGLLIGVLALMVFLLSVGLQHPKPMIRSFLYISFVALGLNLLLYQLGTLIEGKLGAKGTGPEAAASSRQTLGVVRVLQQLIFAVAIIGTVGFALSASQLFFVTPQAQTQGQ